MVHTTIPIFVLSRDRAEEINFRADDYVISITDPGARLGDIKGTRNILRLSFYDICEPMHTHAHIFMPMSVDDAKIVADFVYGMPPVSRLFVHCEAGISRSAGVAAAISKFIHGDDSAFFIHYIPNRTCYTLVLNKLMEKRNENPKK